MMLLSDTPIHVWVSVCVWQCVCECVWGAYETSLWLGKRGPSDQARSDDCYWH